MARVRIFAGYRPDPPAEYAEKGITNAGARPDYIGVIWPDGTVTIRWQTAYQSTSVWACWADFWHVHGHPEYGTRIDFDDGQPAPGLPGLAGRPPGEMTGQDALFAALLAAGPIPPEPYTGPAGLPRRWSCRIG